MTQQLSLAWPSVATLGGKWPLQPAKWVVSLDSACKQKPLGLAASTSMTQTPRADASKPRYQSYSRDLTREQFKGCVMYA